MQSIWGAARRSLPELLLVVLAVGAIFVAPNLTLEAGLDGWVGPVSVIVVTLGLAAVSIWRIGALDTIVIGGIASVVAVCGAWVCASAQSTLHVAPTADGSDLFWVPSIVGGAIGGALTTAPRMTRTWAKSLSITLWTVVLALLLYSGHTADIARAIAVASGALFGLALPRPRVQRSASAVRVVKAGREGIIAFLVGLAVTVALATILDDPAGPLGVLGNIIDVHVAWTAVGVFAVAAIALAARRPSTTTVPSLRTSATR